MQATWVGGLRLSPDLLTAYYHANPAGNAGNTDLYVAQRLSPTEVFADFMPLPGVGFNTTEFELDPTVSGDGLTIVFQRASADGTTSHLFYGTRESISEPFTYGGMLDDVSVSGGDDFNPYARPTADLAHPVVTPDDLTMLFSVGVTDADGGVISNGWVATCGSPNGPFSMPLGVPGLDLAGENDVQSVAPSFVTAGGCAVYYYTYAQSAAMPYGSESQFYVLASPPD